MNFTTFKLAQRDLLKFPIDDLKLMANHFGVSISPKREMVTDLIDAIYTQHQIAKMPTKNISELPLDSQIFRKIGLTKYEYKKLNELMSDISKMLEKYKVRYWMDGGTLLGSFRHGGMIPWDDDVDIGVLDEDEGKLHAGLKSLDKKYDIDWDEDVDPVCRRVIISSKTRTGFPFAEFFIYTIKKGRTHFRCKEDEDSWGKKCFNELKHLFPLRDYPYGETTLKGPNVSIPYFNRCYGNDWNSIAYRQQSHKGGFYYDEDRRVRITKFDHVGSINDDHVYDPNTKKWVKKGSAIHNKLIKDGVYSAESRKPLFNSK